MDQSEFGRIWTLFGELFPASPKLKSKNTRMVWEIGLAPYDLDCVTQSVMSYARKNKFFPDLADITAPLPESAPPVKDHQPQPFEVSEQELLRCNQRNAAMTTREPLVSLALHLVGLQSWPEANADGVAWDEWERRIDACRQLLPPKFYQLRRDGMTYRESIPVIEKAWTQFWAHHGEEDHGVPYGMP